LRTPPSRGLGGKLFVKVATTVNKFLHRWLGIVAALLIILFAVSGIVLNHRSFFSGVDINRKYLPPTYKYHNWNLAAVKSATEIAPDSILIYGNIGIWLTDSTYQQYKPFHSQLLKGIDNRRTSRIIKSKLGTVFAGTMSGLYYLKENSWQQIDLPIKEKRITGITENSNGIWVLTRSHLLQITGNPGNFNAELVSLPFPADFKRETSLFRALWVIHSGKILGLPGKLLIDFLGLIMIFLSVTGIIWFIAPDMMKALRKRVATRKRFARINRFSLKWHTKLGIWLLPLLIILTLTGMFLRPPLLIPIVRLSFPSIKYTILDHPNPWYDKLRDIQYDRLNQEFIISTSDGFYIAQTSFTDSLRPIRIQPPISVMGINVFEQPRDGEFITGSFSGIHYWIPSENLIKDYITGMPVIPQTGMANPFGSIPVAGYIDRNDKGELLFDYNAGIVSLSRGFQAPTMPKTINSHSPMALWNLALEVHTGRFYSFIVGKFYILIIPLAGLVILTILISGGILWWKQYKRKRRHYRAP
jgi:hypothetical protein